jgi:hypothetical protein
MSHLIPQPGEVEEAGWARLEEPDHGRVHSQDAGHWRSVYRELVATMDRLLETARERLAARGNLDGVPSPDTREIEQLVARAEYFRKRLLWWSTLEEETEDSA